VTLLQISRSYGANPAPRAGAYPRRFLVAEGASGVRAIKNLGPLDVLPGDGHANTREALKNGPALKSCGLDNG
jgi:hypothetical protein